MTTKKKQWHVIFHISNSLMCLVCSISDARKPTHKQIFSLWVWWTTSHTRCLRRNFLVRNQMQVFAKWQILRCIVNNFRPSIQICKSVRLTSNLKTTCFDLGQKHQTTFSRSMAERCSKTKSWLKLNISRCQDLCSTINHKPVFLSWHSYHSKKENYKISILIQFHNKESDKISK